MPSTPKPSFFMPAGNQDMSAVASAACAGKADSNGTLAGLRLAVKDVFHIAGLPTTAGNPDWARTHALPTTTHSNVNTLLEHGAQFIGKTVTDELAYSLNGQNTHFGTPTNYAAPNRLPGGSSSGSAAAVAGGYADIGLGTDTGGSIRVPASYNGLYGLRPTHGRLVPDNMVALAPGFDTVGWMTASLDVMERVTSLLLPAHIDSQSLPRIGLLSHTMKLATHQQNIAAWLQNSGAVVDNLDHIDPQAMALAEAFRVLQGREIILQHGTWLQETQPAIAPDIQARIEQSRRITDEDVRHGTLIQQELTELLQAAFTQCSLLVIPTVPGIAPLLEQTAEALGDYRKQLLTLTAIAGLAGLPQLHLPLFTQHGAPCGLSLIGNKGDDLQLVQWAKLLTGHVNNDK